MCNTIAKNDIEGSVQHAPKVSVIQRFRNKVAGRNADGSDKMPKEEIILTDDKVKKVFAAGTVIGLINNNGYNFVLAAGQDLAKQFGKKDFMGAFGLLLLLACFVTTTVHAKIGMQFSFRGRIAFMLCLQTTAYCTFAIANTLTSTPNAGFALSLIASLMCGACQSIGEVNNLSRLHLLPAKLIGAWGAGTGLSEICSPLIYMGLLNAGLQRQYIVLLMILFNPIYWFLFVYIDRVARFHQVNDSDTRSVSSEAVTEASSAKPPHLDSDASNLKIRSHNSKELSRNSFKDVFIAAGGVITNLVAVYYLEYLIKGSFVDRATINTEKYSSWISQNAFFMCASGYGIGVFLSRTSVTFFRISRVWIMTILQLLNCIFWGIAVQQQWLRHIGGEYGSTGFWIMFVWMIWVGLMGGASYANCMYLIHNSSKIPDNLRELAVNMGFAASNIGIIIAKGMALIFSNTFFSASNLYG